MGTVRLGGVPPQATVVLDDRPVDPSKPISARSAPTGCGVELEQSVLLSKTIEIRAERGDEAGSHRRSEHPMTRPKFEVVSAPASLPAAPRREPAGGAGVTATAILLFAALGFASWLADGQLRQLLSGLDDEALGQASRTLEELVTRQREQLVAEVKVLADDNRIRTTVLAPKFDEATVQDVLEDLRKSSGATLARRPRRKRQGAGGHRGRRFARRWTSAARRRSRRRSSVRPRTSGPFPIRCR